MELLNSQKELFHSQIDQLQDVVVTQCKLTGVNPLAQEMVGCDLDIVKLVFFSFINQLLGGPILFDLVFVSFYVQHID